MTSARRSSAASAPAAFASPTISTNATNAATRHAIDRRDGGRVEGRRNGMCKGSADPANLKGLGGLRNTAVSYSHLRAHETPEHLVCRLLLEKKKKKKK